MENLKWSLAVLLFASFSISLSGQVMIKKGAAEFQRSDVEIYPRFPGCEHFEQADSQLLFLCSEQRMISFLEKKLQYPPKALEAQVEGVVLASFIVEKDGSTSDIRILNDIGYGCGNEVRRVIRIMPTWKPGEADGYPCRVEMLLPVEFKLPSAAKKE
jgi:TonB family protein